MATKRGAAGAGAGAAKAPGKAAPKQRAAASVAGAPKASVPVQPELAIEAPAAVANPVAPAMAPDRIAQAYDAMPYQSKPFAQATPYQLAAMARLFKLAPPVVETARVLEIGCSAGGNLIPLAVSHPGLQAVGVDISGVEIEEGKAQLARLGIGNCELHCLDIAQAGDKIQGRFDYIICHGVYSWVPDHVRAAILAFVRDRLSPEGVAYVSYNVYPGWKFREVIRDMMMFHAGGLQEPVRQLEQAKAILEYIKNITGEQTTYGKMLRDEAAVVSRVSDDYLMHEHLSHENKPMYFREFIQQASEHSLSYLGEAFLGDMAPQRLGDEVFKTLSTLSAGNILATEQYMDFFTNRTFRQTLLVHQDKAAQVDRAIGPDRLAGFTFSSPLQRDPAFDERKAEPGLLGQFVDGTGRVLSVRGALSLAVIDALLEARPYPLAVDRMVAAARARMPELAGAADPALRAAVCTELLNLLLQNMVRLHVTDAQPPAQLDRPTAYALARVQAQAGQAWATNVLHQPVGVSVAHRAVLAAMDGQHDHAALKAVLAEQLRSGALTAQRDGVRITDEAQLDALSATFLQQAIVELRQLALLV